LFQLTNLTENRLVFVGDTVDECLRHIPFPRLRLATDAIEYVYRGHHFSVKEIVQ
jgi:hypothetical protein